MVRRPPFLLAAIASVLAASACGGTAGGRASANPTPYPTDDASLSRPLPKPLPDVIAFVNGQPIRVEQVLPLAKKALDGKRAEDIEKQKPLALRRALLKYVDRELLVQEALARGLSADTRKVEWAYDQLRREFPDEARWEEHLRDQGTDPRRLRTELRQQHTVTALVDAELQKVAVGEEEREGRRQATTDELLAGLRAKARIEILI